MHKSLGCGLWRKWKCVDAQIWIHLWLPISCIAWFDTFTATNSCCHVPPGQNIGIVSGGRVHGDSSGQVCFCCVICDCISRGAVPQTAAFCSAAGSNSSVVCCSRVDCCRVIGFGGHCNTPLWFVFWSYRRCHGCWCYVWFVVVCAVSDLPGSLLPGDWFCQLVMRQNMLPVGELLFLPSYMLYVGTK